MSAAIQLPPLPTPQIIRRDDHPEFAVLAWAEYQALIERLEDLEDILAMRKARAEDDGTRISHEDLQRELGLDD